MAPLPDFQTLLLPLLESLNDGKEHSQSFIHAELIRFYDLSDETLKPLIPGGNEAEFEDAVARAKEQLLKADLIERTGVDTIRITTFGKIILSKRLNSLDLQYLRRLPGYK